MNSEQKKPTGYPSVDKPWLKYYSEEDISANLPECTIFEYLREKNQRFLDNIALNYFDRRITFLDLFEHIDEAARAFAALGVRQGDIVVMATVTTPETIYAFYGLNRLGAIPNMVDPRTGTEGIRDYIHEVNARFILTLDVALPKIIEAVQGLDVRKIIVVSPSDSLPTIKKIAFLVKSAFNSKTAVNSELCLRWSDFIANGENAHLEPVSYQKDSCCVIVHTGGTTGMPKGVMLSNDNLNAAAEQANHSPLLMRAGDIFLNILPPFVAYGMVLGIHTALSSGWTSILIPQFDPNNFDRLLLKYHPAGIMGVPSYFEPLMTSEKIRNSDLSFIKVALVGGDKTQPEFEEKINNFFQAHNCNSHISKGYSMTEASSTATISFETANQIGSNGIPLSKTIVAAFDPETCKECPYGVEGEICIQSPTMMLGYYNQAENTNIIKRQHDEGGWWLHTGDLGQIDSDGFVYIQGRLKRMLIRFDGYKVFLPFIENVISKHKMIESCCAVACKDSNHTQGMLPVVFCVLKQSCENCSCIKEELVNLCKANLPEYSQPVEFYFRDELPLTPIGKVDYRALEKEAADAL